MRARRTSSVISSSCSTSEKPCFRKLSAFSSWSPRLAAAESGIRSAGLRSGSSSQMAFAPAPGDYDICGGEQILQFFADITILYITGSSLQGFIHVLLAADMNHLKFLQKFRKNVRTAVFTATEPKTAADNQKHRLVRCKFCDLKTLQAGAGQQLLADRATGYGSPFLPEGSSVSPGSCSDLRSGRMLSLFARPGVMSDSGLLRVLHFFAAKTTGTDTNAL